VTSSELIECVVPEFLSYQVFFSFHSPVEDADVYVDFTNKGFNMTKFSMKALQSIRVSDPKDKDMSGASIFAVKNGTGVDGPPVDIAVAWGQDPQVSRPNQAISMDMGTVTLPFTNVKVAKLVDKNLANAGDELVYTIRVSNVGQKVMKANVLVVKDALDADVQYIAGSTSIKYDFGTSIDNKIPIPDSATGTPFPLDMDGFLIPTELPRRGSSLDISFKVKMNTVLTTNKSKIVNKGTVKSVTGGPELPFGVTTIIDFKPSVRVDNTVMLGVDGSKCATQSSEFVSEKYGANVTYCFKVTNTGSSHLINIQLSDEQIGNYALRLNTTLAPGASTTVFTSRQLEAAGKNDVIVKASPAFPSGAEISDASAVTATDPSSVGLIPYTPNILIDNRVYLGNDGGVKCNTTAALESVKNIITSPVTYCFVVTNTGDSWLNALTIKNNALNYTTSIAGILAPGQQRLVSLPGQIMQDLVNMAVVSGTPVLSSGVAIPNMSPVSNQDPSAVEKLTFIPGIKVDNTAYLGTNGGTSCGSSAAVEYVSDYFDKPVTYCFKITNVGETALQNVKIFNPDIAFNNTNVGTLALGASVVLFSERKISKSFINTAKVIGTPFTTDGRALVDLKDGCDCGSLHRCIHQSFR
jgi:uncharacterized repeat protein (TIGR01451 family)